MRKKKATNFHKVTLFQLTIMKNMRLISPKLFHGLQLSMLGLEIMELPLMKLNGKLKLIISLVKILESQLGL